MANKISKDGAHEIKMHLKSSVESLAETIEKTDKQNKTKVLNAVQPQLEYIFQIFSNIENNWEKID